MSKAMQEALGLPILDDLLLASGEDKNDSENVESEMTLYEPPEDTPPTKGLATTDQPDAMSFERDTDTIYKEAMKNATDLMALGYNVDTRSSAKIFDTAATMLKIALDASATKRTAQMNRAKLILEEKKTNFQVTGKAQSSGEPEVVEAKTVANRNDLIKQLRGEAPK